MLFVTALRAGGYFAREARANDPPYVDARHSTPIVVGIERARRSASDFNKPNTRQLAPPFTKRGMTATRAAESASSTKMVETSS
jgi:hypothetical protein